MLFYGRRELIRLIEVAKNLKGFLGMIERSIGFAKHSV